jgi:hypothetical protein
VRARRVEYGYFGNSLDEWTNTEYRGDSGNSSRLIVGYDAQGGAGCVTYDDTGRPSCLVGIRVAIVLGS